MSISIGTPSTVPRTCARNASRPSRVKGERSIPPFADAIVTYYGEQWPRGADGKILMSPVQSLETYQLTAVNPTPDIAGLQDVIPRLLALPSDLTTTEQRGIWKKTLDDLPPIAIGTFVRWNVRP